MPTSNVFYSKDSHQAPLVELAPKLKKFLAKKLTCGDIQLKEDEISVRLIKVDGAGMIGAVELEITAFAFPDRVKNQDKICLETRSFIMHEYPDLGEVKVWLILAELGHSWE